MFKWCSNILKLFENGNASYISDFASDQEDVICISTLQMKHRHQSIGEGSITRAESQKEYYEE
jgi:hypothetical protein